MTNRSLDEALCLLLERIDGTATEDSEGFPHFADPATGRWTRSTAGDWTGGFWVGQLWLAAAATHRPRYADLARRWAQRLQARTKSRTVFRGFLFWYGAALGHLLLDDRVARTVAVDGARSLATSFHPAANVLPLDVDAEEAESVGASEANIDGVPGGAPLLLWAAEELGEPRLRQIGLAHTRAHLKACVRADDSVVQSFSFDPATGRVLRTYTHKGITDDSTWARAQAWAMLGFAQASRADAGAHAAALRVCDWWIDHLPADEVARWDFDAPLTPSTRVDSSATAIAAAALLKVDPADPERSQRYRSCAERMVARLINHHLTPVGGRDSRPRGILADGCYNHRIGLATSNELIWGDYFLLEALLALTGRIPNHAL
ncbi:MAG: glucuronyl hydrolase [Haloechinothrix sp.]